MQSRRLQPLPQPLVVVAVALQLLEEMPQPRRRKHQRRSPKKWISAVASLETTSTELDEVWSRNAPAGPVNS